jgi:nucleotide-binding universal stress UspA family protein
MTPIRTILVPTDFSAPADAAWRYALGLAGEFKSTVHVLHVVAVPVLYDAWGTEAAAFRAADLLAQSEAAAGAQLKKLVSTSGPFAGRVVTAVTTGTTVTEILKYISRKHVDLVVIGTHGRGLVGHVLLGSVAERLVQRCRVPVVTVHGPELRPPRRKRNVKRRRRSAVRQT